MDWTIVSIITFFGGALLGYLICYIQINNKSPSKIQAAENQQLQDELAQYKKGVEEHFSSSADLLNKMATDYSKIYQHMAQSQQSLLPDSEPAIAPLFIESKPADEQEIAVNEQIDSAAVKADTSPEEPALDQQPRDYVKGSSGIINPADDDKSKEKTK